jgi:hypothetical protein
MKSMSAPGLSISLWKEWPASWRHPLELPQAKGGYNDRLRNILRPGGVLTIPLSQIQLTEGFPVV